MNLLESKLSKTLFWGLLIYCSSKVFTKQSLIKKIIYNHSNDIAKGYDKELDKVSS